MKLMSHTLPHTPRIITYTRPGARPIGPARGHQHWVYIYQPRALSAQLPPRAPLLLPGLRIERGEFDTALPLLVSPIGGPAITITAAERAEAGSPILYSRHESSNTHEESQHTWASTPAWPIPHQRAASQRGSTHAQYSLPPRRLTRAVPARRACSDGADGTLSTAAAAVATQRS